MQTSYQLIFTSCGNVGPYSHSGITYCPLFVCDAVMVHTFQDLNVQDQIHISRYLIYILYGYYSSISALGCCLVEDVNLDQSVPAVLS